MKFGGNRMRKIIPPVFIFVFIFLVLLQNYIFIQRDNFPPASDVPRHITKISEYLAQDLFSPDQIIRRDPYPPLAHLVGVVFFKVLKPSADTASFSLFVFIIIFLLSLYGIGYEYGGHYSGAAVMALGGASPHIINYSRVFYIDFPETAMTALAFFVLLKTCGYRNRLYSILLGFVLCLSFFTKWSMTFYLILPLIWFVLPHAVRSIRSFLVSGLFGALVIFFMMRLSHFINLNREISAAEVFKITGVNFLLPGFLFALLVFLWIKFRGKLWDDRTMESVNGILNSIIAALIVIFLAAPWLLWSSREILDKINLDKKIFGSLWIRFSDILKIILISYNYLPLMIIAGIVFIFIYRERESFSPEIRGIFNRLILPVNLIFCLFLMSYISPNDIRYMLSFIIFLSALGGWWVGWTGKARIPVTVVIVLLSLISITGWLFAPQGGVMFKVIRPMPFRDGVVNPPLSPKILLPAYPSPQKYDVEPIMKILREEASGEPKTILWIFEGDDPIVSDNLRFHTVTEWLRFNYENIWHDGSNRDMLKNGKIIFISCHSDAFAEKELEEIKTLRGGEKADMKRFDYPDDYRLYLLRFK